MVDANETKKTVNNDNNKQRHNPKNNISSYKRVKYVT